VDVVNAAEGITDLFVNLRQSLEKRQGVVAESEPDFVGDGRTFETDLVGLPEAGDFGKNRFFPTGGTDIRQGKFVEKFELLSDASALQKNGTTRDRR